MSSYMIYNSGNLDCVVSRSSKNKCDSFIGFEPYDYLTAVRDLCYLERVHFNWAMEVFIDLKQSSKETVLSVEV